jgi:HD-like signal output (HDOD) protein
MTHDPNLRARLERDLDELPVLPTVVVQLMTLDRSDPDYADKVVALISAEPNFSARVIAAANSAASAPASPITTLGAAIARIGSTNASNMVLTLGITRVFVPRDDWERSLWRHSLQVAMASRALVVHARRPELVAAEAYLAGLLHDIGRFVLFQESPERLREVDEGTWETPAALIELETAICGLDHGQIGRIACEKWSIPPLITKVVAAHHWPPVAPSGVAGRLTAIVHVADLAMFPSAMASAEGYATADLETIEAELCPRLTPDVAMGPEDLQRLIVAVTNEADAVLDLIGLA